MGAFGCHPAHRKKELVEHADESDKVTDEADADKIGDTLHQKHHLSREERIVILGNQKLGTVISAKPIETSLRLWVMIGSVFGEGVRP